MREFFSKFIEEVRLKKSWQKGMIYGAAIVIVIAFVLYGIAFQSGFGVFLDVLVLVIVGVGGFFILVWFFEFIFYIFKRIAFILFAVLAAGVIILFIAQALPDDPYLYLSLGIIILGMLTGGIVGVFLKGDWKSFGKFIKGLLIFGVLVVLSLNLILIYWMVVPGTSSHLIEIDPISIQNQISAQNPLESGDRSFSTFSYGSRISERIPEYGENADVLTEPVNISHLVSMDEWKAKIRAFYWGFDLDSAPLNAQVWMPEGEGPFPLVLIVHGNHNMTDFSEGGYAYLGEHLASRGYIFVSIDQNFLNGYFTGSLKGENDARAKLLLEHLSLWYKWNRDGKSGLYQKIDLENIALMGHSRGGEAAAIAAAMNVLERSPNNAQNRFDYGYNIKSVIAISPSEGQFKLGGQPIGLEDLNYLVVQGTHDSDISRFEGLKQYYRVSYTDEDSGYFKAAVLIERANHSQFNTVWSPYDRRLPSRFLLNIKPIMPEEQQREILLMYVSAFLDATLKDVDEYRAVFENYQNAGEWLPENLYMNQFQSSGFTLVANFEEDVGVETATVGEIRTSGLLFWKELSLKLRSGKELDNQVVEIGWGDLKSSCYTIQFDDQVEISSADTLSFGLVDKREFNGELLDMTIEVSDKYGNAASVQLSDFGRLLPQFHVVFTKYPLWEQITYKNEIEPILQTFLIPLVEFEKENNLLDIENISEIRFKFDITSNGKIYLDEVGFERLD